MLAALKELQQQNERAEKKRGLYVALTRARDHLIMSGTVPENLDLSMDLAKTRIEWIFPALGITGDAIEAGGMMLASEDGESRVRLTIISDPASLPAEIDQEIPELFLVSDECTGMKGTWNPQVFEEGPGPMRVYSVTELEKEKSPGVASARKQSTSR